jgi:hypothetical protein
MADNDFEAAPEGGIRIAGAADAQPAPAPVEEKPQAEAAPETTVQPEEKPEGDEAPVKDEPAAQPEGEPETE